MTDSVAARLATVRERAEAATEGPWEPVRAGVKVASEETPFVSLGWTNDEGTRAQMQADAEFIAHARQDIPWLLDLLAAAHEENQRLRTVANTAEHFLDLNYGYLDYKVKDALDPLRDALAALPDTNKEPR